MKNLHQDTQWVPQYAEQRVRVSTNIHSYDVVPYSEIYGCDVRTHISWGPIGHLALRAIPRGYDSFTGLSPHDPRLRREEFHNAQEGFRLNQEARLQKRANVLLDGPMWETPSPCACGKGLQ